MEPTTAEALITHTALTASAAPPDRDPAAVRVTAADHPIGVPGSLLAVELANGTYTQVLARSFCSETGWTAVPQFVRRAVAEPGYHYDGTRTAALYAANTNIAVTVAYDMRWEQYDVTVAGTDRINVNRIMDGFAALLPTPPPPPPPPPRPDNVIPVAFWMQDTVSREAYSRRRDITVHRWSDVQANYPSEVRAPATNLVTMGAPTTEGSGKLILLHGPPGTGKTRFILTLLSEWRDWCTASVVTDSDKFFGDATYLNSIVFGAAHLNDWLLLVVEDGDDYLNVGSRESKGQSIARLLNIGDGIVGQGINLLTLLTTNVPMEQLNPAIVRPGRALANLNFGPFSPDEANQWCAEHGRPAGFTDPATLASLYEHLRKPEDKAT